MKAKSVMRNTGACICLLLVLCLLTVCDNKKGDEPQPEELQPTLSSIQNNILTPKCVNAGCHPGGAAPMSLASGVARGNLVNVASAYSGLLRVNPGKPDSSVLYLKVIGDSKTGTRMPQVGSALSGDETGAIRDWIENGALDN
jgi:hypothetical protein